MISKGIDITYLAIPGPYIQGDNPNVDPGHSAALDS